MFLLRNTARPLSVTDIAGAVHVSERHLYDLFRRHLDTTPMDYLRRLRLAGAHDDLTAVALGKHRTNIAAIAHRWGFTNPGRFARLYRDTYGQWPSESARSTRSSPDSTG